MDISCRPHYIRITEEPSVTPTDLDDQHKYFFTLSYTKQLGVLVILQQYVISANFDTITVSYFKPKLHSLEMCGLINSTVYSEYRFDADKSMLILDY